MARRRRALLVIGLVLAVVMVAGRFLRQDERYLHATHVGAFGSGQTVAA